MNCAGRQDLSAIQANNSILLAVARLAANGLQILAKQSNRPSAGAFGARLVPCGAGNVEMSPAVVFGELR